VDRLIYYEKYENDEQNIRNEICNVKSRVKLSNCNLTTITNPIQIMSNKNFSKWFCI